VTELVSAPAALADRLPPGAGPDELLDVFTGWVADAGMSLYARRRRRSSRSSPAAT
jgi:hypothetical protein